MSMNPAPIIDPNKLVQNSQLSHGIESNRVRQVSADSATSGNPVNILAPSSDPMDDFYAEFTSSNEGGKTPLTYMTGSDYAAYMDYKKRKLQQYQAESLKQTVRDMYARFRDEKNFAEMEYLEKEFPFIIDEKHEYVRTQQWIMENIADFYANGGKPTAKQLLFQYALKTDDKLQEMAKPIAQAFLSGDKDTAFGGGNYFKTGWLTSRFYPTTTDSIGFNAIGGTTAPKNLPWNRATPGFDYLSSRTANVSDMDKIWKFEKPSPSLFAQKSTASGSSS